MKVQFCSMEPTTVPGGELTCITGTDLRENRSQTHPNIMTACSAGETSMDWRQQKQRQDWHLRGLDRWIAWGGHGSTSSHLHPRVVRDVHVKRAGGATALGIVWPAGGWHKVCQSTEIWTPVWCSSQCPPWRRTRPGRGS